MRFGRKQRQGRPGARRGAPVRVESLEVRRLLANIAWATDADGFFDDPTKWQGGVVPGANDTAIISRPTANPSVTVRGTHTVASLEVSDTLVLAGGALTLNGASQVTGIFTFVSGGLTAGPALNLTGTTTISGSASHDIAGAINNSGVINHIGDGPLRFFNATVTNTGVYNLQSDADLQRFGTDAFINTATGVFTKTGGADVSVIDIPFSNTAASSRIDVQSGTILLRRGANSGGTFNVSTGAVLNLAGGTSSEVSLAGNYSGVGGGAVRLSSGRIETGTGGATFNFPAGLFRWEGGAIGSAADRPFINVGSVSILSPDQHDLVGLFQNQGTVTHSGSGPLRFFNARFENQANALYEFRSDADIQRFGTDLFVNAPGATIRKSIGLANNVIAVPLNNLAAEGNFPAGLLDVRSGSLVIQRGASTGGAFNVASSSVLDLTGDTNAENVLTGLYNGNGAGHVRLTSGSLAIGAGGATFDFADDYMQWLGGSIQATSGALKNSGSITIVGGDTHNLGGTLNNSGTIVHDGEGPLRFFSATVNNQSVYEFRSSADLQTFGADAFNNLPGAVVLKTDGDNNFIATPFNNAGLTSVIDVRTGSVSVARGNSNGGTFNIAANAVLDLTGGASDENILAGTYTGSGDGTVRLASGRLRVASAGATFNFPENLFRWTAGSLRANEGGTLTNTGFITIDGPDVHDLHGVIQNRRTVVHQGTGPLRFFDSTIQNLPGSLYDFRENAGLQTFGTDRFENRLGGTVRKSAGDGTAGIDVPFFNSGVLSVVEVTIGKIYIARGQSAGGTLNIAAGAAIDLTAGTANQNTLQGTYRGSGQGQVQLSGGTLHIGAAGALFDFPAGVFNWVAGSLNAEGALTNNGLLTIAGTDVHDLGGTIINAGTIRHAGTGPLRFFNGTVNNQAGAVYEFLSDADFQTFESDAFNNFGTVLKTSGGDNYLAVPFNSQSVDAVVDVRTGSVTLARGQSKGGTFNVAANAILDLTGGTGNGNVLQGLYRGAGQGMVQLSNGSLQIGSGGATFDFPTDYFHWIGGSLNSVGTLTNNGQITLDSTNTHDFAGVIENAGSIVDAAAGPFRFFNGTLNNQAAAIFEFRSDGDLQNFRTDAFNNFGTVRKSLGGDNFIGIPFNNKSINGVIDVRFGSITLNRGSSSGGTFNVATGAVLDLTGGSSNANTLVGTYTGSGGGNVQLSSGSLATGLGGATFNFPAGYFRWRGGSINSAITRLFNNTGSISITDDSTHDFTGIFNNSGSIIHSGVGSLRMFTATINNQSGGVYEFRSSADIQSFGNDRFNIQVGGTLRKSAGDDSAIFSQVSNAGLIEAGGTSLTLNGQITQVDTTNKVLTGGSWRVLNGSTLNFGVNVALTTNAANVELRGTGAFPRIASLATNAGSFSLLDGAAFTTAGNLTNNGAITLGRGATLTVIRPANQDPAAPTYTQSAGGSLTFQVGGSAASGQFGHFVSAGPVALNGTATVAVADGFTPIAGDVYAVMTYPSRLSGFTSINGLSAGNVALFTANLAADRLMLTSQGNAVPPSPRVTGVFVGSTQWSASFRQTLAQQGLGESAFGYRLQGGELEPLPWSNLNLVSIRFDSAVVANVANLSLRGITSPVYPIVAFTYDPATNTATWTLGSSPNADRIILDLDGDVGGVVAAGTGRRLDGEYAGLFSSGDGREGGDFRFQVNVLAGDATRNGEVNAADVGQVRRRLPGPRSLGYSLLADIDGDGAISAADEAIITPRLFSKLPLGRPAPFRPLRAESLLDELRK